MDELFPDVFTLYDWNNETFISFLWRIRNKIEFCYSTCSYPVWPASVIKESVPFTMYIVGFFVKNQVTVEVWVRMWVLDSIPLINTFAIMSIHAVFITTAMYFNLKYGMVIPPAWNSIPDGSRALYKACYPHRDREKSREYTWAHWPRKELYGRDLRSRKIKANNKWDIIKLKRFCIAKNMITILNKQLSERWRKSLPAPTDG